MLVVPRCVGPDTPEFDDPKERVLLPLGGVKGRMVPRFPLVPVIGEFPRAPTVLVSRPPCITPVFRRTADSPSERLPAWKPATWFCCMLCCKCVVSCWNDCGCATLLCTTPKKCSEFPPRIVDGAAARPLADRLEREGTTGKLPAIMCAPPNCSRVAATGLAPAVPKCPALIVDIPPLM